MWIPVPVPLWVLGSAIKGQEICPAGEIPPPQTTLKSREMEYPAGAPLLQLLTVLGVKATPAQGSSLWCSLWLLLHSFSAESTWLRSTSLTMNYEQRASSKGHSLLIWPRLGMEFETVSPSGTQKGKEGVSISGRATSAGTGTKE